jgi:tetratricopeptide (TPR) repeat protein
MKMARGLIPRAIFFISLLVLFISCLETHTSEVTNKTTWIEKGLVHESNSEFKLAVASFSKAISESPEDPLAWKLRGTSYYRLNEFLQAVSDLDKAISLDPTAPDSYLYRGNAYGEMDMFAKAIEDFDKARKLRDGGYFDNLNQSYISIMNRNFLVGLARATAAIEERPRDPIPHTYRGICLYELGKFPEALSAFQKAISIDSDNAELLFNRGLVHLATRNFDMAISDFSEALAIDPSFKGSYEHRAYAYEQLELEEKAVSDREGLRSNE